MTKPKTEEQPLTLNGLEEHRPQTGRISGPLYIRATVDPGTHLTVTGHINSVLVQPLVDSGATGIFMHPEFANKCQAAIRLKRIPREVRVIDGRVIRSGLITHEATVELNIGGHREILVADLTNTVQYPCVLGTP